MSRRLSSSRLRASSSVLCRRAVIATRAPAFAKVRAMPVAMVPAPRITTDRGTVGPLGRSVISSPEPMLVQVAEQDGTGVQDVLPHRSTGHLAVARREHRSDDIVLVEVQRAHLLRRSDAAPEEFLRE